MLLVPAFLFAFVTQTLGQQTEFTHQSVTFSEPMDDDIALQTAGEGLHLRTSDGDTFVYSDRIEVPLEPVEPFLAVTNRWLADRHAPQGLNLRIRGSADGDSWTDWYEAGYNPHQPDFEIEDGYGANEGEHTGEMIFLPKDTRYIEYEVSVSDDWNEPLTLRNLDFGFISPGTTDDTSLRQMRQAMDRSSGDPRELLSGPVDTPEYVDRETWGESLELSNFNNSRVPMDVTHLVVHHSASEHADGDWPAAVRSFYIFHTETNNWADIGYQWLVGGDGVIFQGRAFNQDEYEETGNRAVIGAHVGGQNTNALGVCVIGNFDIGDNFPTGEALESLYHVLGWKGSHWNIDVLESSTKIGMSEPTNHIGGHRDYGATACPGQNLYDELDMVRQNTHALLEADEYHIPQGDHELGFASLGEAFDYFNEAERDREAVVILHEDLDENASELQITADHLNDDTAITFRAADDTSVLVSITGSEEHGITLDNTSHINFSSEGGTLVFQGSEELNDIFHISGNSRHISLDGLIVRPGTASNNTGIGVSGDEQTEQITITDINLGRSTHPLATGIRIADIDSEITVEDVMIYFTREGLALENSANLEITEHIFNQMHQEESVEGAAIRLDNSDNIDVSLNDVTIRPSGSSMAGVRLNSSSNVEVYNNIITGHSADDTIADPEQPGALYGIRDSGSTGSTGRIAFNTVRISEGATYGKTAPLSLFDEITSFGDGGLEILNNLFINKSEADEALAFTAPDDVNGFTSDYNNYYTSRENAMLMKWGQEATDDLSEWQDWTGLDASSSNTVVHFASELDPRLTEPSVGDIHLAGTPLDGIPDDYFGTERNWTKPYMGVYEGEIPLTIVDATDYYVGREGTGPDGTNPNFRSLSEALFILSQLEITRPKTLYITSDITDTSSVNTLENQNFTEENNLTIAPAYDEEFEISMRTGIEIKNTSHVTFSGKSESSDNSGLLTLNLTDEQSDAAVFLIEDVADVTLEHLSITHSIDSEAYDGAAIHVRRDDAATVAPRDINIKNNQIGTGEAHFADGVRLWGTADLPIADTKVVQNQIVAGQRGITTFVNERVSFEENHITISGSFGVNSFYTGIYLAAMENSSIMRNEIIMRGSNASSPLYLAGININLNLGEIDIINNMISYPADYDSQGSVYNSVYGIGFHREGSDETYNIYHNTLNIEDIPELHRSGIPDFGVIAAVGWEDDISSTSSEINMMNNVFRNVSNSEAAMMIEWDVEPEALNSAYNLWSSLDMDFGILNGELAEGISDWVDMTGEDETSKRGDVYFTSDDNLRLADESIGSDRFSGNSIPEVPYDIDGNERSSEHPYKGAYEGPEELTTTEDDPLASDQPESYELKQNYPNPFNPATTIEYRLPESAQVELTVYSVDGRRVETLVNEHQQSGLHSVTFDASNLASGTYIYRIQTDNFSDSGKMMFIK